MTISHIAVYVNDLDGAKNFFMKYLSASIVMEYKNERTGFRSVFLAFEGGAGVELMNRPRMSDLPKDALRTGYSHLSFSLGGRDKVDALTERLAADGYETLSGPRMTGVGRYESSVRGFEGNLLELTE